MENSSQPTPGSISDTSTLKCFSPGFSSDDDENSVFSFSESHDELSASIDRSNVAIFVHAEPPAFLREEINNIVYHRVPNCDRARLRHVALNFHNACLRGIRHSFDKGEIEIEDASLDPFCVALRSMAHEGIECSDHEELCNGLEMTFDEEQDSDHSYFSQKVDAKGNGEISFQQGQSYEQQGYMNVQDTIHSLEPRMTLPSSQISPPISATGSEDKATRYPVKLPLASLSAATALTSFVTKFSSSRSSTVSASMSIDWVRDPSKIMELKANGKPCFGPVPAGRGHYKLTAPFIFIERKAYVGNKQLHESENQTAVFGALALQNQNKLEVMLRSRKDSDSQPEDLITPFLFSVAVQGPIHELWVHWVTEEHGVQTYQSKLVECLNALLLHQAEELMVKCESILRWGTGQFMNSLLKQLGNIVVSNQ